MSALQLGQLLGSAAPQAPQKRALGATGVAQAGQAVIASPIFALKWPGVAKIAIMSAKRPSRFFYDCEFIEDGQTIELISIGIVDESGERELYLVSTEFDPDRAGSWVRRNVLGKLPPPSSDAWQSRRTIRDRVLEFVTATSGRPQLWAWFAAYDHVALCQLWGTMPELPRALPRYTRDLRQLWEEAGSPALPAEPADAHDALTDARFNLVRWRVAAARHPAYASADLG